MLNPNKIQKKASKLNSLKGKSTLAMCVPRQKGDALFGCVLLTEK